jgi:hypothetical protein
MQEFAIATKKAGYRWFEVDLTPAFAIWMNSHEYRESYFRQPDALELALQTDFQDAIARQVADALGSSDVDDKTVVGIIGVGALFPMARVSKLIEDVASRIRGRLLVFFPGDCDGPNYRLLNARDGWNYLAIPITARGGEAQ